MSEIPRGPEDIPLKGYIKEFPIVIIIYDIISNRPIREERINYSDGEARKWLGRICYWACANGYSVKTIAEKDYKPD